MDGVLASYSQVLFSRSRVVAVLVLLATFVVPTIGATGLAGVLLATLLARLLGLDPEAVRSGELGYNALLVFLLIGALLEPGAVFWAMAALLAAVTVLLHVALSTALRLHLRLPALSLPFVFVGWIALAAVPYVRGMGYRTRHPALDLPAFPGPEALDTLLRSLGAIFFQPHWIAGALVLSALLVMSRIATLHALLGATVAVLADRYLFAFPKDLLHLYVGFNFIVTAVALGGIFYVPGPASLLLAGLGSLAAGWVAVGLVQLLAPFGLPVLALPFNVTALVVLYAFALRRGDAQPRVVDFVPGTPEDNLNHYRTRIARFRRALPVRMQLPVRGDWVVTQGVDGPHTHQGAWRHALDFEVEDAGGSRFGASGSVVTDYHAYGLPVLAPAAGTVVRVVDGIADCKIGAPDLEHNWGNLVLVQHAPACFSLVAHLQAGSISVAEGAYVVAGQPIARVGSSGRCPTPHLHFQLQATPTVGDPTIPLEVHDIVVGDAVVARALPTEGQVVRNLRRQPDLVHALGFPIGQRLRATVEAGGRSRVEELVSEVDLLGQRSLFSPSRDARLWFADHGDTFVVYDHVGPRDGALFALYAALARVPLEGDALTWEDRLNPRRLGTVPLGWLRDAVAAVLPPPEVVLRYRSARQGGLIVTGESVGRGRKVTTEARLRPGVGVERVEVAVGARRVFVTLEPA